MPKITIIVPVYNVEKYLKECLDSLVSQTIDNIEVICINDGSTDNSKEILEDYQNRYSFVKVINHEKNKGLSAARNTGIKNATGEYILFVDSDDFILHEACEKLYKYAKKTDSDVVFYNLTFLNDYENGFIRNEQIKNDYPGVYRGIELFTMYYEDNCAKVESVRQFLRRTFVINNNLFFYEGIIHEDMLYYFNTCKKANRATDLNESLYIYRQRGNSINWSQKEKSAKSLMCCIQNIYAQWLLDDNLSKLENEAVKKYIERLYKAYLYKKPYENSNVQNSDSKEDFAEIYINTLSYRKVTFSNCDLDRIVHAGCVTLYGAGMVATDVAYDLQNHGIEIENVIVSKNLGYRYFNNVKVLSLDEVELKKDTLFLIATDEKYHKEICENLRKMGYENYIFPVVNSN